MEKPQVTITVYADQPERVAALYALMGVGMDSDGADGCSAVVEARLEIRRGDAGRTHPSGLRLRIVG